MIKAGIAIDGWKLSIFERHLSQAGYAYEKGEGLTADSLLLTVNTENVEALASVVRAANREAARTGAPEISKTTERRLKDMGQMMNGSGKGQLVVGDAPRAARPKMPPAPIEGQTCETCLAFCGAVDAGEVVQGVCRMGPPQCNTVVVPMPQESAILGGPAQMSLQIQTFAKWPNVSADCWCLAWMPKPAPKGREPEPLDLRTIHGEGQ